MEMVFCANRVAKLIADQVENAVSLTHPVGCSQVGEDLELTARTLVAMGNHPNLAAVLVVGLGCERFTAEECYGKIKPSNKPLDMVVTGTGLNGTNLSLKNLPYI